MCQPTDALERDGVPLPLEALGRLLEHRGRLGPPVRERENLGQVGQRVAVHVQEIGFLRERDRLACERLGLGHVAPPHLDLRAATPPQDLREDVLGSGGVLADAAEAFSLLELVERTERVRE